MNIEDRLKALETKFGYEGCVHGTQLVRVMNPKERGPLLWSLGMGPMHMAREFFTGETIEEVLTKAEAFDPDAEMEEDHGTFVVQLP